MAQPAFITLALAIAVAVVMALVLFSGRLSPTLRRRAELALLVVIPAACIVTLGWSLLKGFRDGEWSLDLAFQPIMWVWIVVSVIREHRRKRRAQTRQPGTFA